MTSMIDMAFLLITFFIMSIRFGQAGEEMIKLPDADQAKEVTDERVELVTVNVTEDGLYVVGGVNHSTAELTRYLETRRDEGDRKLEIVIRGDKRSQFAAVQRVMRVSAEIGIADVSLAALQQTVPNDGEGR
jgi:biopolymer transport protein ExbD